MNKKILPIIIVLQIILFPKQINASIPISVGNTFAYIEREETTFSLNGTETHESIVENYTLEILYINGDVVGLKKTSCYTLFMEEIIGTKDNYKPFDIRFPQTFLDPNDFDFFYNAWEERGDNSKNDPNVDEHFSASRRTFIHTVEQKNYVYNYGQNETLDFLRDTGNYKMTFEVKYTEDGVTSYIKKETSFKGQIVEMHRVVTTELQNAIVSVKINLDIITIVISVTIFGLGKHYLSKRRKEK
ncbi:MAG: hypothetical protein ACTSYD_00860 [Candidatus Heimdallarchaeaceae archaeon]